MLPSMFRKLENMQQRIFWGKVKVHSLESVIDEGTTDYGFSWILLSGPSAIRVTSDAAMLINV